MIQPNKIRIEIYGVKFVINSTESPDYVKSIARALDEAIRSYMTGHPRSSLSDADLITLLDYADRLKKCEQNADHLRAQLSEYLEESARAHLEVDEYKREIDKLKREINLLRQSGVQPKETKSE